MDIQDYARIVIGIGYGMNDFTKEELEKLQASLSNFDYGDEKLWDKLQSLIDNYKE